MIILILIVLGLCFGSFINALVWRLRQQEALAPSPQSATQKKQKADDSRQKTNDLSILRGHSMCPDCRHGLAARDLVPVLSWLGLRGKCRYCRKPIAWQYPLVELLTAALFVFSYAFWPYGFSAIGMLSFVVWLAMLVGFIALIVYDLRWMLLPNRIIYPLLGLVAFQIVITSALQGNELAVISQAVWGLIFSGGIFYVLFQVSKGRWIGGGDVKLGFLLGLIVGGPVKSLLMLFLASSLGTLVAVPLLLGGRATRGTRIPFGPFLIAAAIIVQLFGQSLITWYYKSLGLNS